MTCPIPEDWLIVRAEEHLLANRTPQGRLGFATLLKFFQVKGRFPDHRGEISDDILAIIANQVGGSVEAWHELDWEGRTIKRYRAEIREWCGFREAALSDLDQFKRWLVEEAIPKEHRADCLREALLEQFRNRRIEPPAPDHLSRFIQSAIQEHETRFCKSVFQVLDSATVKRLDDLLLVQSSEENKMEWTVWQTLKAEPGKAGLDSVKEAVSRLNRVREVGLPADLFKGVPPKLLDRYAKRASVEEPFELRRHAEPLRATLMAVFLHRRSEDLTDHLVDLLVETVHKMGKKAEKKVEESREVAIQNAASGKMDKLYRMAKASLEAPKGVVEEVIFPAAPEQWLRTFIAEVENGVEYKGKVRGALQRSYRSHYRRMLPMLLNNLKFKCANVQHQPVMEALKVIKENIEHKGPIYPTKIQVPLKGVVPSAWRSLVVEEEGAFPKINRIAYEICVLK